MVANLDAEVVDRDLADRLYAVLGILYLIYNAGADQPEPLGEPSLRDEAIRLARLLAGLMPEEPEVAGLLALLLLTDSRQAARYDEDGSLVLLRDQDRTRWSRHLIVEGQQIVRACLRRDQPGPYQLQAVINALHAEAVTFADTDWPQIVALYDHLLAPDPSPVVALNRAIAVAEVEGPEAAWPSSTPSTASTATTRSTWPAASCSFAPATSKQAREVLLRAAALAPTDATRQHLRRRAEQLARQQVG